MAFAKLPIPGGRLIWRAADTYDWLAFRDNETVAWLFLHLTAGVPTYNSDPNKTHTITVDWPVPPTLTGWLVVKAVVDQEVTEIGA